MTQIADSKRFCPACGSVFQSPTERNCAIDNTPLEKLQDTRPLVGSIFNRNYRLLRELGQGGTCVVFEAEHVHSRVKRAVKVIYHELGRSQAAVAWFKREAEALGHLKHPNTVRYHDSGYSEDGYLFLAMELLQGETLADTLARATQLTVESALQIALQVCDSLSEAHQQDLVHRDIKATNIFLLGSPGTSPFVKVIDFGVVKGTEPTRERVTARGLTVGTAEYMSPEQAKGDPLDCRSDIYSLGVVLYEMVAGQLPFDGNPTEMMRKHVATEPPSVWERSGIRLPQSLETLLQRVLAKDASNRPQSCDELRTELLGVLEEVNRKTRVERVFAPISIPGLTDASSPGEVESATAEVVRDDGEARRLLDDVASTEIKDMVAPISITGLTDASTSNDDGSVPNRIQPGRWRTKHIRSRSGRAQARVRATRALLVGWIVWCCCFFVLLAFSL